MAEDDDQSSKTEDPSQRKLDKLREEGNVPTSKEVGHVFALVGVVALIGLVGPHSLGQLLTLTAAALENAGTLRLDSAAVGSALSHAASTMLAVLLPILLMMMGLGILGSIIQNGPMISGKPIQPSLEKISPLAGFGRLFSLRSLGEFVKSLLKLTVVSSFMIAAIYAYRNELMLLVDLSLGAGLTSLQRLMLIMVGTALAVMVVLALADVLFQRFLYYQQHRMSLKELKDEMKESEGDPHIKQRQRQIRQERARNRMMAAVPKADVIITNPTHYAVALRYKPDDGDAAPVLVAKGLDHIAERIREVAREHNVPFYEDPPLARQLYGEVDIGQSIPIQLYEVVAKVIAFVQQLKNKRK
jgi:flagellar biosynthesis protein FlhB